jgi:predicted small secreted protein
MVKDTLTTYGDRVVAPQTNVMKKPIKHIVILTLASVLVAAFTAGCGTVRGIGRDVGTVGHGIEKSTR